MTDPRPELSDALLAAWLAGDLGAEEVAAIEDQVVQDPRVASRADRLAETMALLDQAAGAVPRDGFSERLAARVQAGVAASVTRTTRAAGRSRGFAGHRRRRATPVGAPGARSGRERLERLTGALAVVLIVAVTGGLGVTFFRSQTAREVQSDVGVSDGRLDPDAVGTELSEATDGGPLDPATDEAAAIGGPATVATPDDLDPSSLAEGDDEAGNQSADADATAPADQGGTATGTLGDTGGAGQQPSSGVGGQDTGGGEADESARPTGDPPAEDPPTNPTRPPAVDPGSAADPSRPAAPVPPADSSGPDVEGGSGDDEQPSENPAPDPVTSPVQEESGDGTEAPAPAAPPPAGENDGPTPAADPNATSPRVLDSQATLADQAAARAYFGGRGEARAQLGLGTVDARARGASHLRQLGTAAAFSDGTPPGRCAGTASSSDPSVIVTVESVTFAGQPALAYLVVTGSPTLDSARVIITDRTACGVLAEIAVMT